MAVSVHAHFKRIAFEARRRQAAQAAEKSSATLVAEQAARMEAQRVAESSASQPPPGNATESTRPQGASAPLAHAVPSDESQTCHDVSLPTIFGSRHRLPTFSGQLRCPNVKTDGNLYPVVLRPRRPCHLPNMLPQVLSFIGLSFASAVRECCSLESFLE